jgi:hypothetical protein
MSSLIFEKTILDQKGAVIESKPLPLSKGGFRQEEMMDTTGQEYLLQLGSGHLLVQSVNFTVPVEVALRMWDLGQGATSLEIKACRGAITGGRGRLVGLDNLGRPVEISWRSEVINKG